MSITSIRLSSEIELPLEKLASKMDRSKNYLINQAIKEFVARQALEDSRWEQTLEALHSVKEGKAVDEDSVVSWLKSWGENDEISPPKL